MNITPFFRDLHTSYQAEIDDMTFDSDGQDVLHERLAQRRREMDFLVHMIEPNPEMVAVVFHQGFRFRRPAVLEHLLTQHSDELPSWDALTDAVELVPWAKELADRALQQPTGDWFLAVSAGLEYLHHRTDPSHAESMHEGADDEYENDHAEFADHDQPGPVNSDDIQDAHELEDAGADWMVEQGFDRKD